MWSGKVENQVQEISGQVAVFTVGTVDCRH